MEENKKTKRIIKKEVLFLKTVISFFIISSFLFYMDFIPERHVDAVNTNIKILKTVSENTANKDRTSTISTTQVSPEFPVKITIDSIGLNTKIITPKNKNIDSLDRALLSGAVYYPESAMLGEKGNMLLFGHSSYLPVVRNKAFKAFNDLNKLKNGDLINVYSEKNIYTYEVVNVKHSAAKDVSVNFDSDEQMLTLSTCDNFGNKEDRWIVTGKLKNIN